MKSASSHSAKRQPAKHASTSIKSALEADEHPEADLRHIVRGIVRRGLEPVPPKTSISLRVDSEVLDWFKAQGPGYQTRMNAVLRAFRDASLAA
ncbi:MAG TPA: BrnA antitoxin family protein [Burkholderiaceae bacterium]|jgi:uncharacterized protein (DUF4415 family)|nr:BrnA antitoxin family protein [Burkholderiaceae bacterium]